MSTAQHRQGTYQRVFDDRKRPIRGLWKRNDRFYAQLTIEDEQTGLKQVRRVPLEGATTAAQARDAMDDLRTGRRKGDLPVLKRTPLFKDYAAAYLDFHKDAADTKRASTMETEGYAIDRWIEHLGHVRLDKISPAMVSSFIAKRQKAKKSARTVNLEVTVLRNVLKRALFTDRHITRLPTVHVATLKQKRKKRALVSTADLAKLVQESLKDRYANGREFADYLQLMAYAGTRRAETLSLKHADIDWDNRQLAVGATDATKNNQVRHVDFNEELEAHLKDMKKRRAPDTVWLFPSPRRGEKDKPAKTFRETLLMVRQAAGLPRFGFHDCRHHFISMCVMSGIDYMTIARWVGHQDGGILIGKVYGHLSNEHAQNMAAKVTFAPTLMPEARAAARS